MKMEYYKLDMISWGKTWRKQSVKDILAPVNNGVAIALNVFL